MTDWRNEANCKNVPTDWFYELDGLPMLETLTSICDDCPVKPECLDWAIEHETFGFFAGTTGDDRKQIRKEIGITCNDPAAILEVSGCGTTGGYSRHLRRVRAGLEQLPIKCIKCKDARRVYQRGRHDSRKG